MSEFSKTRVNKISTVVCIYLLTYVFCSREEVDVQGVDGHIYKGRSDMVRPQKLEARLPTTLGTNNNNLVSYEKHYIVYFIIESLF